MTGDPFDFTVTREVTNRHDFEVHLRGLLGPDVTTVMAPDVAARTAELLLAEGGRFNHALAEELLYAAAPPDNCSDCRNGFAAGIDGLCVSCRDAADQLKWVRP